MECTFLLSLYIYKKFMEFKNLFLMTYFFLKFMEFKNLFLMTYFYLSLFLVIYFILFKSLQPEYTIVLAFLVLNPNNYDF